MKWSEIKTECHSKHLRCYKYPQDSPEIMTNELSSYGDENKAKIIHEAVVRLVKSYSLKLQEGSYWWNQAHSAGIQLFWQEMANQMRNARKVEIGTEHPLHVKFVEEDVIYDIKGGTDSIIHLLDSDFHVMTMEEKRTP